MEMFSKCIAQYFAQYNEYIANRVYCLDENGHVSFFSLPWKIISLPEQQIYPILPTIC